MDSSSINIYCDESCHLQNDGNNVMALGAVYCPASNKKLIFNQLLELKRKYNLIPSRKKNGIENRSIYEIKWNKVSKAKLAFYKDVIDLFFNEESLSYRVLIVPDKSALNHELYGDTHDSFYYKMYFNMLKVILNPDYAHNIYIDIKDTKSREKVHKLEDVLRNDKYDFDHRIIRKVQQVRSHEVELIQLADLLTGAMSYVNRGLHTSNSKNELVDLIQKRSNYQLTKSTLVKEKKFNVFIWHSSYQFSHE